MSLQKQKRMRLAAGWICLVAVGFMYAPLAAAAWMLQADCCAAGFCQVPAHHHGRQKLASPAAAEHNSAGMNCEHEIAGMRQCTMSCCQDESQPVLMPVAFVLPAASFVPGPGETLSAVRKVAAFEILRSVRPASPPPRLAFSIS